MKRKFLEDLGLEKETIDKILDENSADIGKAKENLDALKAELDAAKSTLTERDSQLETLKNSASDIEGLKKQIETLQADNKVKDEEYATQIKDMRLNTAIQVELAGKVHDADIVAGLFDKSKIEFGEDGKISTGLKEQFEDLQKSKPFLFVQSKPPVFGGVTPVDGMPGQEQEGVSDFNFQFQTVRPLPENNK